MRALCPHMSKTLLAVSLLVVGIASGCAGGTRSTAPTGPIQPAQNGVLRPPGERTGDCGAASLAKSDNPCLR